MDALLRLVFDNFFLLIAFAVAWNVAGIGYRLWKRKGKGLVFPKPTDPGVVYSERFSSGSSHKSWRTRLGGANNCLTVVVTETHLAITTFFPFTAFLDMCDLEHLIPLSEITDLSPRDKVIDLAFRRSDGTPGKVTLRLRNTAGFLHAVQQQSAANQAGAE